MSDKRPTVPDLMAALEASLVEAKFARLRRDALNPNRIVNGSPVVQCARCGHDHDPRFGCADEDATPDYAYCAELDEWQ